jgi:hypothetical protein
LLESFVAPIEEDPPEEDEAEEELLVTPKILASGEFGDKLRSAGHAEILAFTLQAEGNPKARVWEQSGIHS